MFFVFILWIKIQIFVCSIKRVKFGVMKEGGDKKWMKLKVVGVVFMVVMGFFCVVMLFGFFDQGFNGFGGVDDYLCVGNV